eukprot:EG_transcript_2789
MPRPGRAARPAVSFSALGGGSDGSSSDAYDAPEPQPVQKRHRKRPRLASTGAAVPRAMVKLEVAEEDAPAVCPTLQPGTEHSVKEEVDHPPPGSEVPCGSVKAEAAEMAMATTATPPSGVKQEQSGPAVINLDPEVYVIDSDGGELSGNSDMWRRVPLDADSSEVEEGTASRAQVRTALRKSRPRPAVKAEPRPPVKLEPAGTPGKGRRGVKAEPPEGPSAEQGPRGREAAAPPPPTPVVDGNDFQALLRQYGLKRRGQDWVVVQHQKCLAGMAYRGLALRHACTVAAAHVPTAVLEAARQAMASALPPGRSDASSTAVKPSKAQVAALLQWFATAFASSAAGTGGGGPFTAPGGIPALTSCSLRAALDKRSVATLSEATAVFCSICHALGIPVRLVMRLDAEPRSPFAPVLKVSAGSRVKAEEIEGRPRDPPDPAPLWCEIGEATVGWVPAWPMAIHRPALPEGPVDFRCLAPYTLAFGPAGAVDVTARYSRKYSDVFPHRLEALPLKMPLSIRTLRALAHEVPLRGDDFNEASERLCFDALQPPADCGCGSPCARAGDAQFPWRDTPAVLPPLVNVGCGIRVTTRTWLAALLHALGDGAAAAEEERQLQRLCCAEPMPATVKALRQSPLFVTKDLLAKRQVIYQGAPLPTLIKGVPVYLRTAVHFTDTREGWLTRARAVREGEAPVKRVPPPPAARLRLREGCLYGAWQTEPLRPPALVDGRLPTNRHGNVELLYGLPAPAGTVHLRDLAGVRHAARQLGVEHAPVVVDFEWFGAGRCAPCLNGILVHARDEAAVRERHQQMEDDKKQKVEAKRVSRILRRWETLVKGLVIRAQVLRDLSLE